MFRIVYDDGEMEDLDLTKEIWRFSEDVNTNKSNDPAANDEKNAADDDADIVEVVLDGSDTPVAETSKVVTKPKQKRKERKAISVHVGERPQQKLGKKEGVESAPVVSSDKLTAGKESKETVDSAKSAPLVAVTEGQDTSTNNFATVGDPEAQPLDTLSKVQSKQKNVRNKKETPVDEAATKAEAVPAAKTNAAPEYVVTKETGGDGNSDVNTVKESTSAGVNPVSSAQNSAPSANQPAIKAGSVVFVSPSPAASRGEADVQVAKGNEHQNCDLEQRVANGNEVDDGNKSKVKVVVVQKPSEPLVKVTPPKTIGKERKSALTARGKAVKMKTLKGKADGASHVNLSPSVKPKVRLVKSKSGTASTVVGAQKEGAAGSKSDKSAGSVVDTVAIPSSKTAGEHALKGEDSIKSRSSAGKDLPSFAAERKRKKKKQPDEQALLVKSECAPAVILKTTDIVNSADAVMASGGRLNNPSAHKVVDPAQGKASTPTLSKSVVILNSNSGGAVDQRRGENQIKATIAQNGSAADGTSTPYKDTINSQQAVRAQTKNTTGLELPGQGQKRGRTEQFKTGASGVRTSTSESESMAKRLRSQSSPPSETFRTSTQKTTVHGTDASIDTTRMRSIVFEAMTPLYSVLDSVKSDVHRLASMLPSQKQEVEFFKDVVHRSVVEEGSNVRTSVQELRSEMLQALDSRARETEHRMIEMMERLFEDRRRAGDNLNGYMSSGQQYDPQTTGVVPNSAQMYETRQMSLPRPQEYAEGSSQAPVMSNVPQSAPSSMPIFVADGRNASPTAIANVNPNEMTTRYYDTNEGVGDPLKEAEGLLMNSALGARVSHLVARQITVWLLETPHEHDSQGPISVEEWARVTASGAFAKVAENLRRFSSYAQAYQTLCSSLGNDAVELQWFVSPGDAEHLHRARRNYAAWDPPPTDEEWRAEVTLLGEMSERFSRALVRCDIKDMTDMEACVAIANTAATEEVEMLATPDRYQLMNGIRDANQFQQ